LLVKDPNQIEEGFKIITHQRRTSGLRRLDILGVDSEGVLTLIEHIKKNYRVLNLKNNCHKYS